MPKWFLPTISEVVMLSDPAWARPEAVTGGSEVHFAKNTVAQQRAQREWQGAIAALTRLLQQTLPASISPAELPQALLLTGPVPILSDRSLLPRLSTWTMSTTAFNLTTLLPFRSLPGQAKQAEVVESKAFTILPLIPGDPLANEQFCFVLTPRFSLVVVLGEGWKGEPVLLFSFLPEAIERTWEILRPRVLMLSAQHLATLDQIVQNLAPIAPDYHTVMQFSRWLLEYLPEPREENRPLRVEVPQRETGAVTTPTPTTDVDPEPVPVTAKSLDVELLQAIAHEVRTPLTTIRTLTRSLLRRTDLPPSVIQRLESINHECNEQIDRFGLIFRAVELETAAATHPPLSLTRTSLAQVLQQVVPQWQKQAAQRGLVLNVALPPIMPAVVSDPNLLDKALTGLVERFTRNLPAGSHIQVDAALAGDQLKLQLQSQVEAPPPNASCQEATPNPAVSVQQVSQSPLKSLGQLLMFQPETGSLTLNLAATKNLFQSLGGKLTVRERPQQGEILTVYLPLEGSSNVIEV